MADLTHRQVTGITGFRTRFLFVLALLTFSLQIFGDELLSPDAARGRVTLYTNQEFNKDRAKDYFQLLQAGWEHALSENSTNTTFSLDYGDHKVEAVISRVQGMLRLELRVPAIGNEPEIRVSQFLSDKKIPEWIIERLEIRPFMGGPEHFSNSDYYSRTPPPDSEVGRMRAISTQMYKGRNPLKMMLNPADTLETMDEVFYLYAKLVKEWKRLEGEYEGTDFLNDVIKKNGVNVSNVLGTAELNSIDDEPFVRVVHKGTEMSFVIRKEMTFDNASDHFRQYIARQHIVSNSDRPDKLDRGRDVIVINVEDFDEVARPNFDAEKILDKNRWTELRRAEPNSKEWWMSYWRAVKKMPSLSSLSFGATCGAVQGVLCLATGAFFDQMRKYMRTNFKKNGAKDELEAEVKSDDIPLATLCTITASWGTGFGAISSMFKNWVNIGPNFNRTIKNMTNGLLFQYIITIIIFGDMSTLLNPITHAAIFSASWLSNRAKPNWYNFSILREKLGQTRGDVYLFGGPNKAVHDEMASTMTEEEILKKGDEAVKDIAEKKGFQIKWSKSNIDFQLMYIPAFITRFSERLLSSLNATIPFGLPVLAGAIPFSEGMFLRYVKKKYKNAKTDRERNIIKPFLDKAQGNWEAKKAFFNDPDVPPLLMKKIFKMRGHQAASARLREKYPQMFKAKKKKVKMMELGDLRPFNAQKNGPCIDGLLYILK